MLLLLRLLLLSIKSASGYVGNRRHSKTTSDIICSNDLFICSYSKNNIRVNGNIKCRKIRGSSHFQVHICIKHKISSDEGEYICPRCTVFGLEKAELQELIGLGFKITDHNKEDEGYEVQSSAFKVSMAAVTH